MTTFTDSVPGPSAPSVSRPGAAPRRIWLWLCLAAILLLFALTVASLGPASNFGGLQDDATYFALAKALAAGRGYYLPSFPGGLTTLKYPELYPWLLSWIWRFDPRFPGNVDPAIGLNVFFSCWFLVACFWVARKTFGLEPAWALAVTALCAFNFFTLILGGSVLSDLPFGALALSAALAADRSLETDGDWKWMALAGALAGFSVGLRTVGVMVIAGIALVAVLRHAWRQAGVICVVGGGLSLPWILPVIFHALAPHASTTAELPLGWTQTLAFYASYVGQWKHFVPNWETQRAVLLKNSFGVLLEPGIFLLFPLSEKSPWLSVGMGGAVALAAWLGIVFRFRRTGWKAIDAIFLAYLAMVLPWPFPPQRFLAPFLPFLFAGIVLIFRELARHLVGALRSPAPVARKVAPAAAAIALIAVAGVPVANCAWFTHERLSNLAAARRTQLEALRATYRWISSHTPTRARFIAYDDVLLYLYTGRQAIRAIAATPASDYDNDPSYTLRDAAHLDDVAQHVGANYWLVTPSDFGEELGADATVLRSAENRLLAHFPVAFQDDSGRIQIFALPPAANLAGPSGNR
jgi:hypothetical protein